MTKRISLMLAVLCAMVLPLTAQNGQDGRHLPDDVKKKLAETMQQRHVSQTRVITAEELLALTRVYSPTVSPDGRWVLFGVTVPDIAANRSNSDLHLVSLDGERRRRLTASPAADFGGVWSPDGKSVAFLSSRSGSVQIHTIAIDGGEAVKVSDIDGGVSNLSWSPDGRTFAFTADVPIDSTVAEKYPAYAKANVRIYDRIHVRHWDHWNDEQYEHLFIMPSTGGEARDLMAGERVDTPLKPFGGAEQIAWSPDGREIAYTAKKVADFAESTNSDVYVVNVATGETRNITEGMPGFDRDPLYSPDGRYIAFHSMARAGHEADRNRLMLYERASGTIRELSATLDQWVGSTVWAPDSRALYFTAESGATVQVYRIAVNDGSWEILTAGVYNHDGGLDITPDGKTLVYGRRNFNAPTELYAQPATKEARPVPLTMENTAFLANIRTCTIEERWIPSTDGKRVQTWVVYPPDFDPKKKYPLITYCQGGPQATVSQFFSYAWNFLLYASKGYVVVAPNRRGLPGFGQDWNDAISQDWGGLPMQDILACTDALLKEPFIDTKHVSAIGASAGGYAVFWLAGNHEGRFSSFVSHCGVFNLESMYGATEELWFTNWENGGPYWDPKARANYDRHSPHRFAQHWDTPILIITGEKDFRVPYTQSLEAFTVAQVKGIPSKLIVYPEENHWVLHPQEQLIWFEEFFDFIGKHRKN
ncbi:MAG: S9 family peptidase [Bacteroidota bacterium]|jgi:dipeptidyl aminopeptidase/acylaminoacyl peptidase|nr:S9 family peptidase [Bacteroidota bacterium]